VKWHIRGNIINGMVTQSTCDAHTCIDKKKLCSRREAGINLKIPNADKVAKETRI
jgi:hypothetical protein